MKGGNRVGTVLELGGALRFYLSPNLEVILCFLQIMPKSQRDKIVQIFTSAICNMLLNACIYNFAVYLCSTVL